MLKFKVPETFVEDLRCLKSKSIPRGVIPDAPSSAVREQRIMHTFLHTGHNNVAALSQLSRGMNGPGMISYLGLVKKK